MKEKLIKLGFVIDNEYLDKYCELIELNKNTQKEKFKTQAHHIIPRYTKLNNNEIVNLTYKDHILAHYYLCFCSSNNKYKFANENTIVHIFGHKSNKISIEELQNLLPEYEKILIDRNKEMSLKFKGKKRNPETIAKMSMSLKGKHYNNRKPMSEETKKLLSKINKGKSSYIRTLEHKELMSKKFKGHKVSEKTRQKISETLKRKNLYASYL